MQVLIPSSAALSNEEPASSGKVAFQNTDHPLRGEILSREALTQLAITLGDEHRVTLYHRRAVDIYPRFEENALVLERAYFTLAEAAKAGQPLTPGGEWLLDNYHVVEQHVREIRDLLPKRYYRSLPVLTSGIAANDRGTSRVYALVLSIISHTDAVIDAELLTAFISSYQSRQVLSIGELWAIPIMLRLALLENLRRLAITTLEARATEQRTAGLVKGLLGGEGLVGTQILLNLAAALKDEGALSPSAISFLIRQLRAYGPPAALALDWFEQLMIENGTSVEDVLRDEWFGKAANQVSIGNCFTSLKSILALDWLSWFETNSAVDTVLRRDPAGAFSRCDFPTRNRYRSRIENLARQLRRTEIEIANELISLTEEVAAQDQQSPSANTGQDQDYASHRQKIIHVGYYLIGRGVPLFHQRIGFASRNARRDPTIGPMSFAAYQISIASLTIIMIVASMSGLAWVEVGVWHYAIAALLLFIPATDIAINIVHWLVTNITHPVRLAKLDLSEGVPNEYRTVVAVHSILRDPGTIKRAIEFLEVRYLANSDRNICFALLADLPEATVESTAEDLAILSAATDDMKALNDRYFPGQPGQFLLLTRTRVWNDSEGCFLGWERKRGKVMEFNRLLLGTAKTTFTINVGDAASLERINYVITLDADTSLPHGSAKRLIGTIAHPLNAPEFDAQKGVVVEGYAIIQPRVGVSLESGQGTLFSRVFAGDGGLDPYTLAVSDVYQDLFHEGSFIGKGIYDVKAFARALEGRVPENALLSHDLFEGLFGRAGLASDIELYDEFPQAYNAYAKRQHRWVRGDWQLLPWLANSIPQGTGGRVTSTISRLGRWKLLDNLRRSLMAPTCIAFLFFAWLFLPGMAWEWALLIFLIIAFPVHAHLAATIITPPFKMSLSGYARDVGREFGRNFLQAILTFSFLPYQAFLMLDAIVITLYRLYISKKNLLDWETAYQAERRLGTRLWAFILQMSPAWIVVGAIIALLIVLSPGQLAGVSPVLALWLIAPLTAYVISKPLPSLIQPLNKAEQDDLTEIAWDTWKYFKDLATEETNYLIPDNLQLFPRRTIAYRTSPTNIGLYYLSLISAADLGFLSPLTVVESLHKSFVTLVQLERLNGHLYNWYDIQTLVPLDPRYVSTVDSGNFVASLLALANALEELLAAPLVSRKRWDWIHQRITAMASQRKIILGPGSELQAAFELPFACHADVIRFVSTVAALAPHFAEQALATGEESVQIQRFCDELNDISAIVQLTAGPLEVLALCDPAAANISPGAPSAAVTELFTIAKDIANSAPLGLLQLESQYHRLLSAIDATSSQLLATDQINQHFSTQLALARSLTAESLRQCEQGLAQLNFLKDQCDRLVKETDFSFLFDSQRKLFTIGFQASEGKFDNSYYDLLASEARVTSLIAIAKGDVPLAHWFALGRGMSRSLGGKALLSWSGTMFEYLMPLLLTKDFPNTILHGTYQAVVRAQRLYASKRGVPWGISESGYAGVDFEHTYQYRAFGVPGLGLKRGLSEDLVISPYSTFLAISVAPMQAIANLKVLEKLGMRGEYGFYESIDFTTERLVRGEEGHIVRSFLAHHQGMTLVALNNILNSNIFPRRFHRDPLVRAVERLLQEKFPERAPLSVPHQTELTITELREEDSKGEWSEIISTPHTVLPRTRVLSNGYYSLMIDNAGSGYSFLPSNFLITRWREDPVVNALGSYVFVSDLNSKRIWSTTYQPARREPEFYEAIFSAEKVEFKRRDFDISLHTELTISPEDNVEVRRITATNFSRRRRQLQFTSFAEIVLNGAEADAVHPAFSKMFVQSEFVPELDALIFTRRPRSVHDTPLFILTMLTMPIAWDMVEYETSRERFIGRGRDINQPVVIFENDGRLSNTVGPVLDPIAALRTRMEIQPNSSESLSFITALGKSREEVLFLARRYSDVHSVKRAFEMAWSKSNIESRTDQISIGQSHLYQHLANALFFQHEKLRSESQHIVQNRLKQSNLWRFGISGDLPIVLVSVSDSASLTLVQESLQAHEYLRDRCVQFDLVIVNEIADGYLQELHASLEQLVRTICPPQMLESKGGVFLRNLKQLSPEEYLLLRAVARLVFLGEKGEFAEQLRLPGEPEGTRKDRRGRFESLFKDENAATKRENSAVPGKAYSSSSPAVSPGRQRIPNAEFENGFGGFIQDGGAYAIDVSTASPTPAPWINVIANPNFGFTVSEMGSGYTWSDNCRENRLTPWSNDPVTDRPGEVIYIRDANSGAFWCPTPLPVQGPGVYRVEHHHGFSTFAHQAAKVQSELTISGSSTERVKWWNLRLSNLDVRPRRLEIYLYVEWLLGVLRSQSLPFIVTRYDRNAAILTAQNFYNNEFAGRIAFVGSSCDLSSFTASRMEFVGRNHTLASPAVLENGLTAPGLISLAGGSNLSRLVSLSGKTGAGRDACGALKIVVSLEAGEERDHSFFMGESANLGEARSVAKRYRTSVCRKNELRTVQSYWDSLTSQVEVKTPDRSFDILMNQWLLYQCLSARVFGRTGFYQSGGAFGFRDQLQDGLSLLYSKPDIARDLILQAASRQFIEGDVQHWWHPPTGRGVRTRISDDYLWLPYVVDRYLETTGDDAILDETAHFIEAPLLEPGQMDAYLEPRASSRKDSIYTHCILALTYGLKFGEHGLPLIGAGDWNDGFNEIGREGRGESVWLGWFLVDTLKRWIIIAESRNDSERAAVFRSHVAQLVTALEQHGWDGKWYRRAFFDDGTPLGSALNDECQIDSIAQSWAVISGAAAPERAHTAMESLMERLVNEKEQLVLLLTPPFDKSSVEPGYIKGYLPGVRENGGQYTHAAAWTVIAAAMLGWGDIAHRLFSMINPINHTSDRASTERYRGEPYVTCGDVYSQKPHVGRAGWSWYTGSCGWLYQAGLIHILGLRLTSTHFTINPCIPAEWMSYSIKLTRGEVTYLIEVENPSGVQRGVASIELDGIKLVDKQVNLFPIAPGETSERHVRVVMGATPNDPLPL